MTRTRTELSHAETEYNCGSMSALAFLGSADLTTNLTRLGDRLGQLSERATTAIIVPTASAYEGPAQAIAGAVAQFCAVGITADVCPVLTRVDADNATLARQVESAAIVFLTDGSAMHLRSTLKDSAVWHAMLRAWHGGALLMAAPGSGMALGDPMIDPRGGAFGLGLGLIHNLSVVPGANTWSSDRRQRMLKMAGRDVGLALIDDDAILLCDATGNWSSIGNVTIMCNGEEHPPTSLGDLLTRT